MGHQAQTRRILRMRDICQKSGLCPSTVHDLVARCCRRPKTDHLNLGVPTQN